jgi:dienelactone hydrolase
MPGKILSARSIIVGLGVTALCEWTVFGASTGKAPLSIQIQGTDVLLSWPAAIGESYDLEHTPPLNPVNWQPLATNIPQAASGTNLFLRAGALTQAPRDFFRLSVRQTLRFRGPTLILPTSMPKGSFTGIMIKPAGTGPFPAVIIQHGAGGTATGYSLQKAGEMMPWGLVCIAPTLTHAAGGETNPVNMGFCAENLERARACLNVLLPLSYVETNRLAIFGHSMGAFASIGDASVLGTAFRACVSTSGGVIPDSAGTNNAAPTVTEAAGVRNPFLLFACDADPIVPPMRSQLFQQLLNSNSVPNLRILYSSNSIPNSSNWHNIHQDPAINANIL